MRTSLGRNGTLHPDRSGSQLCARVEWMAALRRQPQDLGSVCTVPTTNSDNSPLLLAELRFRKVLRRSMLLFPRCKMGKSSVRHRVGLRALPESHPHCDRPVIRTRPAPPGPGQGAPPSQTPRGGPPLPPSLPACLLSDLLMGKGGPLVPKGQALCYVRGSH